MLLRIDVAILFCLIDETKELKDLEGIRNKGEIDCEKLFTKCVINLSYRAAWSFPMTINPTKPPCLKTSAKH